VPRNYVRVEIDFDQIEGQSAAATTAAPQTPRAVEDSEALRVAVAQRAERDALRSELKSAAPGIAVVRNAASKTTGADDAMTKILELQDRQAALLVQRKEASTAAARIVQLQQAHQGTVVARRESAKLSESGSERGSGRESEDGVAASSPAAAPAQSDAQEQLTIGGCNCAYADWRLAARIIGRRRTRAQRVVVIVEEEVARRYGHIASSFGSRVVASFICV
jgi:hypothetical protein